MQSILILATRPPAVARTQWHRAPSWEEADAVVREANRGLRDGSDAALMLSWLDSSAQCKRSALRAEPPTSSAWPLVTKFPRR